MLKIAQQSHQNEQIDGHIKHSVEAIRHHQELLSRYLNSHKTRNHSAKTLKKESSFLESWFDYFKTNDNPFLTWEAMQPIYGRQRIIGYANTLIDTGLAPATVRSYLGILSRYFSYVLENPYVAVKAAMVKIADLYGEITQPISEFDAPKHSYDGSQLGIPFDPEKLYDFYSVLRNYYLDQGKYAGINGRNYTMVVLAVESGLRIDELLHLELNDLFFDRKKLQTRYAKGTKGSGKRARVTLFTPLARDTVKFYITHYRPFFVKEAPSQLVFMSKTGKQLGYASAHKALKEMITAANKHGFPVATHMGYHWLRKTFATRFIERFPNQLAILINVLGHQTPNTVHCYIRHSEAWMDKQIIKMLEGGKSWPLAGD